MDFMNVLSLAIGMITVYLVLALSVTAFNEAIAALLSSRGKWLRRGVASLFSSNARDHGDMAIACKVYDSPYIAYLQRGSRFLPSYLPAWNLLQGMLDAASKTGGRALATLDDLRVAAKDLPEGSPIRTGLENLLAAGDTTVEDFQKRYEAWFATFEAQVMAWYRQKTQLVVGGLSLVVALAMNVDTLQLVNQLATDPKVREALADQGGQLARQPDLAAAAASLPAASQPGLAGAVDTVQQRSASLNASGLKLGWTDRAWHSTWQSPLSAIEKLVGLLLSAFAVSMGAPFWFDLLKNLVSIRAVGKNLSEQNDARDKAK
jgi:hypothetical protein